MRTANIHASCVVCAEAGTAFGAAADAGVLVVGESGSGKSDLVLRLLAAGARLVADDRCEIFFDGTALRGRAPQITAGMIEIRGLGIITLPFAAEARIALVVRVAETPEIARLPAHHRYRPPSILAVPESLYPPELAVDTRAASAPTKILVAVSAFENRLFREDIAT